MQTVRELALTISKICRESMDAGEERAAVERVADMCDEIARRPQKTNGVTHLSASEQLRMATARIVSALQLDEYVGEQIAQQVELLERSSKHEDSVSF